jgi:hypothetical protein
MWSEEICRDVIADFETLVVCKFSTTTPYAPNCAMDESVIFNGSAAQDYARNDTDGVCK